MNSSLSIRLFGEGGGGGGGGGGREKREEGEKFFIRISLFFPPPPLPPSRPLPLHFSLPLGKPDTQVTLIMELTQEHPYHFFYEFYSAR